MIYSYQVPNSNILQKALLAVIERHPSDWSDGSFEIVSNGTLELDATKEYHNDKGLRLLDVTIRTKLEIYESFDDLVLINITDEIKYWLNEVFDSSCGYKVGNVNIVPSLKNKSQDAKNIILDSIESEKLNALASDLLENGKRLSQAYVILYCLENLLRDFIDKKFIEALGSDYEEKDVFSI